MFAAQSRARIANLRVQLTNTKRENFPSAQAYFGRMKGLSDELAAAGHTIDEDELVEYILAGLDDNYNPIFAAIGNGADSISLSELYARVAGYESRMQLLFGNDYNSSANMAGRGCGRGGRGRGAARGRGGRGGGRGQNQGRGGGGGRPNQGNGGGDGGGGGGKGVNRPICQICGKQGHEAWKCWYRFDEDYEEEDRQANIVHNYHVDTNWNCDTGATDHITSELDKLTMKERYNGHDQVHTANDAGQGNEEGGA